MFDDKYGIARYQLFNDSTLKLRRGIVLYMCFSWFIEHVEGICRLKHVGVRWLTSSLRFSIRKRCGRLAKGDVAESNILNRL